MNSILTDTGYWVSLLLKNDLYHKQACEMATSLKERSWVTTWPVITEVCYFLQKKSPVFLPKFLNFIEVEALNIFDLNPSHMSKAKMLLSKYGDYEVDFADVSLMLAAEALDIGDIVSTDFRDFAIYRWNKKPFINLMNGIKH